MLTQSLSKEEPALRLAKTSVPACRSGEKVGTVIGKMLSGRIKRMHLIDDESFQGFVTSRDILDLLGAGTKASTFRSMNGKVRKAASMADAVLDKKDSVGKALGLFRRHNPEALPFICSGKFMGILSRKDIVHMVKGPAGMNVRDIMSDRVFSVSEDLPVFDAAKILCRGAFRRIPVAEKGILRGIVTPHDIVSHLSENRQLEKLKGQRAGVKTVMKTEVVTVRPDADVADAVELMKRHVLTFLPVTEDTELLGIVTEQDVLDVFQ